MLSMALGQVYRHTALARTDTIDLRELGDKNIHDWVHVWQYTNPVSTEALLHLTIGAPQVIYNGGLLYAPIRYFDAEQQRPGLPADVAALVEQITAAQIEVLLVNLNPVDSRTMIVQGGTFGEHRFSTVTYDVLQSDYPGKLYARTMPMIRTTTHTQRIDDRYLRVVLPPGTQIRLRIGLDRLALPPTYAFPWHNSVYNTAAELAT